MADSARNRIDSIKAMLTASPKLPPSPQDIEWLLLRIKKLELVAEACRSLDCKEHFIELGKALIALDEDKDE